MKLKKKIATAAITAALVVPQTVAPAAAQYEVTSGPVVLSTESQIEFWNGLLLPIFGVPLMLSSVMSSVVAPQCSLFDTRGCNG